MDDSQSKLTKLIKNTSTKITVRLNHKAKKTIVPTILHASFDHLCERSARRRSYVKSKRQLSSRRILDHHDCWTINMDTAYVTPRAEGKNHSICLGHVSITAS